MKMNVLSIFERQTLPFQFFSGIEQNGKNVFILAPRKVVEWLERFSLCSVNIRSIRALICWGEEGLDNSE